MKSKIILFLVGLTLVINVIICEAAPPAPYTRESVSKLHAAVEEVGLPDPPPVGSSEEEKKKRIIQYMRKIYKMAGYDFDKSVVQFVKDMEKDPKFPEEYTLTSADITAGYIHSLIEDNLYKHLSKDAVVAIDKMIAILKQRKEAEEKKEQEDRQKREEAENRQKIEEENRIKREREDLLTKRYDYLKRFEGHYETYSKITGEKLGELDININSIDNISFSLYHREEPNATTCTIKDKTISKVIYSNEDSPSPREAYYNYKNEENDESCQVRIDFTDDNLIRIESSLCIPFCEGTSRFKRLMKTGVNETGYKKTSKK